MNSLIPFKFENHDVRVVMIDGTEWWVGKDVAESLGFKDAVNAIKQHCRGGAKHHPLETAGGKQEVRILSEGDVWRLITHSKLPIARRFEKWIFEEVLPQIRKTGAYVPDNALQNIKDLQARVLELEINRSVTEKSLLNALRTVRRYEEQRLMTYADKREILTLYVKKYRISDIQRITKKSRGAIRRFLDWFFNLDHEAFEGELKKITHEDFWNGEFFEAPIAASRGHDGGEAI
jgi:prophage antirepressor-like protein